jgi:diguanylate cyclase (GGDEF)-like protein
MEFFYLNVSLGASLIISLIIVDYVRKYNTDVFQRNLFLSVLFSTLAAVITDFVNRALGGIPGIEIHNVLYLDLSLFLTAQNAAFYLIYIFIDYFVFKSEERSRTILKIFGAFMAVYVISVMANLVYNYYFYISEDNYYTPAALYMVRLGISYLPLLLSIGILFISRGKIRRVQVYSIIFFGILTGIGAGLDIALRRGSLIWPCFAAALLYFYFFIVQSDSKLDSLTGLGNRFSFNEFIAKIADKSYSIIMVDMDHFKEINDTQGHLEGDNALRDMASIIKGCLRSTDFAARYGGDEFIIAVRSEFNVERLMERIQSAINNQNDKETRPYKLQMSYGWDTFLPEGERTVEEFLAHIDKLMYQNKMAKRAGRNAG